MKKVQINENWINYYIYLEKLRISGKTNMYGAASYMCKDLNLDYSLACTILGTWMNNYDVIKNYLKENNMIKEENSYERN